jgi:hypothetical protein
MRKGVSRAVLKIVEEEMHEAWRKGYEEGRQELAQSIVPAIIEARFGLEVVEASKSVVRFTNDDRLAEITLFAAICPDFGSFYARALSPKRKRRR